jgi:geranylgeranyl pyrophosphate synthase
MDENIPTDFKDFIAKYKSIVYNKISEYLIKNDVKQRLDKGKYNQIMRVYVDRLGQYRRPSYTILWTMLYGGNVNDAILPAAIQQLSEDWLLMLDDIFDDSKLRRGAPAAHTIYPINYVINAASELQAINWRMIFDAENILGEDRGKRYVNKFFDILKLTHRGQYLDMYLTSEIKDITKFTPEDYFESIHAKSAYYSVYGPMQVGAIIAGVNDESLNKIKEYGVPLGNAFQIKDDILDCTSTDEKLGKTVSTDVRDGVKTIILWHAVNNAPTSTLNRLKEIYMKNKNEKTTEEIQFVLNTFKELGSIDYAQKEVERLVKLASEKFDEASKDIPESPIKLLAKNSIDYNAKRVV